MIEQASNNITFAAQYIASKAGKTGLICTVDMYQVTGINTVTVVSTGSTAFAIGGGLYGYTLPSSSVGSEGMYYAIFKTTDTTVDVQHIPALWCIQKAGVENLDATISSRSTLSSSQVWTYPGGRYVDGVTGNVTGSVGSVTAPVTVTTLITALKNSGLILDSNTAFSGGTANITLGATASNISSTYADCYVTIVSGAGVGQCRRIAGYSGGTQTCLVEPNWTTQPDNTSLYIITPGGRVDVGGWLGSTPNASVSGRVDVSVGVNNDKTGYTFSNTFISTVGTVTGAVTVGTNNDKSGYSVIGGFITAVNSVTGSVGSVTSPVTVGTNLDKIDYELSGVEHVQLIGEFVDAVQEGMDDQGYTTARATKLDNLDVAVSTRLASGNVTLTPAEHVSIRADVASGLTTQGYTTARAPKLDNLDTTVSSRQASGNVTVDLTQALNTANTGDTVGGALLAARAQGFGKWAIAGTTLTLYAADGTTVVRTFSLDDPELPTSRT